MLKFKILDNGNYLITEEILSFHNTVITNIEYTLDFGKYKLNDEPWSTSSDMTIRWCKKHYLPKLKELE